RSRAQVTLSRASVRTGADRELVVVWMADFVWVMYSFGFVLFWLGSEKEMSQRPPDSFVEIAAQRIVPEKLDREFRRADERTQDPRELRAEKKISGQPADQYGARDFVAPTHLAQQSKQPAIRNHAGKRNRENVRHQHNAVPKNRVLGFQRRRINPDKQRERRKTGENGRRNCEAHHDRDRRLLERESRSENLREHPIDRAVA